MKTSSSYDSKAIAVAAAALMAFMVGCAQLLHQDTGIPQGAALHLKTALQIGPHSAHTDVQYGVPTDPGGVNLSYPFCKFEVERLSGGQGETLQPGSYRIVSSEQYTRPGQGVLGKGGIGVQVAGLELVQVMAQLDYITEMTIAANPPPNLQRVYCHNVADVDTGRFLTLTEINKALRPTAEIVSTVGSGGPSTGY
jgi:hypothetical protein